MRTARVTLATIERLRDAADRYGISQAEIMRRASVAYLSRVVILPNRETTTRDNSTPIQCLGLDARVCVTLYGQVANWYLDEKDNGGRLPVPVINPQDAETPYILEQAQ